MTIEASKLMEKIANKQFEMIGEKITFADIPEDGIVEVGKKKEYWWNVYHFTEEQEREWKEWALDILKDKPLEMSQFNYVDMRYGFQLNYKKGG